jgi:RHS repeat-associated protein
VTQKVSLENQVATSTVLLGALYEATETSQKRYVYLGGDRIAEWHVDGTKYFYVNDHLGGSNVITSSTGIPGPSGFSGAVVQRIEYKPYGEVSTSQSGGLQASLTYAGARKDGPGGLYDFGARFYDPRIGRFISVDPVLGHPLDPNDLNPYGYALGSPVEMVDVDGLSAGPSIAGLLVGVAVSLTGCVQCGAAAGGAVSGAWAAQEAGGNPVRGALTGAAVGAASSYALESLTSSLRSMSNSVRASASAMEGSEGVVGIPPWVLSGLAGATGVIGIEEANTAITTANIACQCSLDVGTFPPYTSDISVVPGVHERASARVLTMPDRLLDKVGLYDEIERFFRVGMQYPGFAFLVAGGLTGLMSGEGGPIIIPGAAPRIPFKGFQEWGRPLWGRSLEGAQNALREMTPEMARTIDPGKARQALEFYKQAGASGRGGETAAARVRLMERILELQR